MGKRGRKPSNRPTKSFNARLFDDQLPTTSEEIRTALNIVREDATKIILRVVSELGSATLQDFRVNVAKYVVFLPALLEQLCQTRGDHPSILKQEGENFYKNA